MYHLIACLTVALDRLIADHGMALLYHHRKPSRFDGWHDRNGAFTLQLWRFEFIRDKGLPPALRRAVND